MTDLAATEPMPSTVLDTDLGTQAGGAGAPRTLGDELKPEPKEPPKQSLRETLTAAMKDADKPKEEAPADDQKPDEDADKAKGEAQAKEGTEKPEGEKAAEASEGEPRKPDRAPDGKFAKVEAEDDKKAGHIEPPKTFLPDAKEHWRNTPRTVQRDVENMARTYEEQVTQHKEAAERYEAVRDFDEVARRDGGDLRSTLTRLAQLDTGLKSNPIAALNRILIDHGPRKADGQPVSLFELAQHIVNSGQDNYHKAVQAQPQQQQQQDDPRVAKLEERLAQIQAQTLEATIIAPFKAEHPRYEELRDDIAFFLQSGKIPQSLSPADRLAAAYDMAARINPPSQVEPAPQKPSPDPARRVDDSNGSKSIKSAPGAVTPDLEPSRGGSIRDLLNAELRRARRS